MLTPISKAEHLKSICLLAALILSGRQKHLEFECLIPSFSILTLKHAKYNSFTAVPFRYYSISI